MYLSAVIITCFIAASVAWDESYPIYCNEDQEGPCITRLSGSCYACIHPIEAACPGTDKDFLDCLCPIPSNSWTAIEACFNDTNTGCNDGATSPTSEVFALFNAFAVECNGYNQFICEAGAKLDPVEQTLSIISDCNPTAGPPVSISTSTHSAPLSTTPPAQTSTAGSGETQPTKSTTSGVATVPTSNAATSGHGSNGLNAVALVLAGGIINAL